MLTYSCTFDDFRWELNHADSKKMVCVQRKSDITIYLLNSRGGDNDIVIHKNENQHQNASGSVFLHRASWGWASFFFFGLGLAFLLAGWVFPLGCGGWPCFLGLGLALLYPLPSVC